MVAAEEGRKLHEDVEERRQGEKLDCWALSGNEHRVSSRLSLDVPYNATRQDFCSLISIYPPRGGRSFVPAFPFLFLDPYFLCAFAVTHPKTFASLLRRRGRLSGRWNLGGVKEGVERSGESSLESGSPLCNYGNFTRLVKEAQPRVNDTAAPKTSSKNLNLVCTSL